ncbi:MAG: carbohydrate ABC transporter permease [Clostridia bacterium]|nr:carbohydrate ABC transporter permease [Clostridia bacterium]
MLSQIPFLRKNKEQLITLAILIPLALLFLFPVLLVLYNSFKGSVYISNEPFALPDKESFVGVANYLVGLKQSGFFGALFRSFFITVSSVLLLALASSMCAWFLHRMGGRVSRILLGVLIIGMVVPFQMVMYTTTFITGKLGLASVYGMPLLYLAFGASLSVFILSGFVKGIPVAVEEAATIDGCGVVRMFFGVVMPLLTPALITVSVLNAMWIWNDYLLPYLVLGSDNRTIPVAIQLSMTGAYGSTNLGGLMAMLIFSMIPIVIFYLFSQKYIIDGVSQGAVKG